MKSARWVVGKGDKIETVNDCWLASGDMVEGNINSVLFYVCELIDPISKSWDLQKLRLNFQPSTAIKILQTPIAWNYREDTVWWPKSKSGDFTVKSGYYQTKKKKLRRSVWLHLLRK